MSLKCRASKGNELRLSKGEESREDILILVCGVQQTDTHCWIACCFNCLRECVVQRAGPRKMPETSNTQDVSVREENGAEGGVAGPQSRLSFKGTQGSERQLEILRAAHSHPNIFVYGKKQEAWLEICHVLNPNPLFAGKLTPTTAKDKFEELKSNWLAKNRKLLAAGGLNELKSEYDKLFREVILLENEHEEARRTKKTCTQRSKDIRLSDSEWCKDFFVESNPPVCFYYWEPLHPLTHPAANVSSGSREHAGQQQCEQPCNDRGQRHQQQQQPQHRHLLSSNASRRLAASAGDFHGRPGEAFPGQVALSCDEAHRRGSSAGCACGRNRR
eukprot:763883-Hanusia_phi.AAC.1